MNLIIKNIKATKETNSFPINMEAWEKQSEETRDNIIKGLVLSRVEFEVDFEGEKTNEDQAN